MLKINPIFFKSYIVFGVNSNISKLKFNYNNTKITNVQNITTLINNDLKNNKIILNHASVDKIYLLLKDYSNN